ncbi:CASP C terminal-domain-containing protein [Pyronema omphalodes]|nr:CASP C terminal-domain-containing protein [Pyronema omphalodes]
MTQTSAFQAAIGAWRNIDLTSLQKSLDSTADEIVNSQRESLVERKELAQKTKEYRKLDDEQKKEEWKGLLKSYQIFIDHLTTSKKTTEQAFLSIYSTLSEAPDPYPLLEATIDSLVNFSELQTMTKDNASLKATINRLNSQVSNLESSIASKNKELERKASEKAEEAARIETIWKAQLDEKTRAWESKEKALNEKLAHQEGVLKELKASYEVSQRMGNTSTDDDLLGKERAAELEIVNRDLERTTLRLAEAESRNEELRLQLSQTQTASAPAPVQDDETLLRLQHENATLLRKLNTAKTDAEQLSTELSRKIRTLERQITALEADKASLKSRAAEHADYADLKRELEILKSIEFSTGDDDEPATPAPSDNAPDSLEHLLLARNKKLGNELTVLRVSHQDLSTRLANLQTTLDSTTAELTSARQLISKLEDDLLSAHTPQYAPALSVVSRSLPRRVSPASSIIGSPVDSLQSPVSSNPGILPMVTAQRDRFRTRNTELEQLLATANTTVANLRDEVAALQKDNLALYEKTRYVGSYTRGSGFSAASSGSVAVNMTGADNRQGGIERYRQAYEANISPFEAFRGRESARAYRRLGCAERMVYSATRVILANRVSRNLFAAYCVLLHVMMISWLYTAGIEATTGVVGAAGMAAAGAGKDAVEGAAAWKEESFDGRL